MNKEQMKNKVNEANRIVKSKIKSGMVWASDNKEILAFLVPVGIGAIVGTTKFATKRINLRKTEQLKNLYCYDRSLGHYWKLKRVLTNTEWTAIGKRKNAGEKLVDILSELRVLE